MGATDFSRAVLDSSPPTGQASWGRGGPQPSELPKAAAHVLPGPHPHRTPQVRAAEMGVPPAGLLLLCQAARGEGRGCRPRPSFLLPAPPPQVASRAPGGCSRWLALDAETRQPRVQRRARRSWPGGSLGHAGTPGEHPHSQLEPRRREGVRRGLQQPRCQAGSPHRCGRGGWARAASCEVARQSHRPGVSSVRPGRARGGQGRGPHPS